MVTPERAACAASRYETFVIRLWVDRDAVVEHGEIRHIASNHTVRFRDFERAVKFIARTIASDVVLTDDLEGAQHEMDERI